MASKENNSRAYRTQTEDDLQVPPMSTMQKVIIGIALAAVVAAIVYVNFFPVGVPARCA